MAREESKVTATGTTNENSCESEYSAQEFADNVVSVFGKEVSPDCVIAAFRIAGIAKTTKSKAQKIVNEFIKKEVK